MGYDVIVVETVGMARRTGNSGPRPHDRGNLRSRVGGRYPGNQGGNSGDWGSIRREQSRPARGRRGSKSTRGNAPDA